MSRILKSFRRIGEEESAMTPRTCLLIILGLLICSLSFGGSVLPIDIDVSTFEERIESDRKVQVEIEIVDRDGEALENISVSAKQLSHEFYFGNAPEYLLYVYAQTSYNRGRRFGIRPLPEEDLQEYKRLYLELFHFVTHLFGEIRRA